MSSPILEIHRYQSVPILFPRLTPCFPLHISRRICCPDEVERKIDGQIGGHSVINSRTTTHFRTYEDRDKVILCRSYSDWHFCTNSYALRHILGHSTTFSQGRSYRFHSGDLDGVWGVALYPISRIENWNTDRRNFSKFNPFNASCSKLLLF